MISHAGIYNRACGKVIVIIIKEKICLVFKMEWTTISLAQGQEVRKKQ
jgi:hypothetical protein